MNRAVSILVTGADSQLGKTLQALQPGGFEIDYTDRQDLDITDEQQVLKVFARKHYDFCFNFAAYTDVNAAETDKDNCFAVNTKALENLALASMQNDVVLLHISTDYVFDGKQTLPYSETDTPQPLNYYGKTKLWGEEIIQNKLNKYFIIRTSWLYSAYNRNFVKTILKLGQQQDSLQLVNDQKGTPTNALDLIRFILEIIDNYQKTADFKHFGIYHFSNGGSATWYDFGKEIIELNNIKTSVSATDSQHFVSPAKRPAYSVLSKQKAINTFGINIRHWQEALQDLKIE